MIRLLPLSRVDLDDSIGARLRVFAEEFLAAAAVGCVPPVLYDCSTLHFETYQGEGFCESGFCKERRRVPDHRQQDPALTGPCRQWARPSMSPPWAASSPDTDANLAPISGQNREATGHLLISLDSKAAGLVTIYCLTI
jgi:hypothetical protein